MVWQNAKITGTQLGPEDHGIFTCYLSLDLGSAGTSFGGYDLRGPWGWQFIEKILSTVGVRQWEQLPGKYVRVKTLDGGTSLGHIVEDRWFDPRSFMNAAFEDAAADRHARGPV